MANIECLIYIPVIEFNYAPIVMQYNHMTPKMIDFRQMHQQLIPTSGWSSFTPYWTAPQQVSQLANELFPPPLEEPPTGQSNGRRPVEEVPTIDLNEPDVPVMSATKIPKLVPVKVEPKE